MSYGVKKKIGTCSVTTSTDNHKKFHTIKYYITLFRNCQEFFSGHSKLILRR